MPFTDADRKRAYANSIAQRRKDQARRRRAVKELFFTEGLSKAEIARRLNVNRRTIEKDVKALLQEREKNNEA